MNVALTFCAGWQKKIFITSLIISYLTEIEIRFSKISLFVGKKVPVQSQQGFQRRNLERYTINGHKNSVVISLMGQFHIFRMSRLSEIYKCQQT